MVQSAVLILTWNRPDKLSRLVKILKELKIAKIYIWRDGPRERSINDLINCMEVERVIDSGFAWGCIVKKKMSGVNLGCKDSVHSAINWFFSCEDEGIIIEDDCLPNGDFFSFCDLLLDRYRDNHQVWTVSGSNFQDGKIRSSASYYFSKYCHSWGWATWKDRWTYYEGNEKYYEQNFGAENKIGMSSSEWCHWKNVFDRLYLKNRPNSWALRWLLTCFANNGLTAIPKVNLVRNIGFDQNATHTKASSKLATEAFMLKEIIHPDQVLVDQSADLYTFKRVYSPSFLSKATTKVYSLFSAGGPRA